MYLRPTINIYLGFVYAAKLWEQFGVFNLDTNPCTCAAEIQEQFSHILLSTTAVYSWATRSKCQDQKCPLLFLTFAYRYKRLKPSCFHFIYLFIPQHSYTSELQENCKAGCKKNKAIKISGKKRVYLKH